jgi:hypothetical protein
MGSRFLILAGAAALALGAGLHSPAPFRGPVVDAHNCYPYQGQWADRIDRALSTGFPVSIEQDIAWGVDPKTGEGRPVVSHAARTTGSEPSLESYFFERVQPVVEKALAENHKAEWPLIVLHFDFKSTEPKLLHAVWDLLGRHEAWITTALKTATPGKLEPFDLKPLLVITEDSDEQAQVFDDAVPVGARLRVFGSAHTEGIVGTRKQQIALMATLPPEKLLPSPATNYRRWWNNSWYEVEEGGEPRAGAWTAADDQRVRALVDHAHRLGYWIRFYTLDGFAAGENRGWDRGYNFGSRAAVLERWRAAVNAGVDFIATDQYEDLARVVRP